MRRSRLYRDWYTPSDIAYFMGVSPNMVRVSLRQRAPGWDFPFYSCGRNIRIPCAAFDRWYRERYGKEIYA